MTTPQHTTITLVLLLWRSFAVVGLEKVLTAVHHAEKQGCGASSAQQRDA